MSKIICTSAIDGAVEWVAQADAKLSEAIARKGEACKTGFPDTAYYLPIIYSLTGEKVETLGDMRKILNRAKLLLPQRPSEHIWLPYLGNALDAGIASLFACEIIEACKYCIGPNPIDGIWLGAANDIILRERGVEFVDGTAPGFAAITGAAPSKDIAVKIARQLQEKNLYIFMGGCTNGVQFAEQLADAGVELGWKTRLVPYGRDVSALIYALGFANRVALSFGGIKPGDFRGNLKYNKNRIFAFVLTFGEVTPDKYAIAAGAINYGFPVIADTAIPQILPTGVCTYEHVVSSVPYESMVEKALEVRGCKIKVTKVPIPVAFGPAFEGEIVRRADMQCEWGSKGNIGFEWLRMKELNEIEDGKITIVGPDITDCAEGSTNTIAIIIDVAGRKMQKDFEPVLERQTHNFINCAEGVQHIGQRDIVWIRISKNSFKQGFRLKHLGSILHASLHNDFGAIVDKVQVTIYTEKDKVDGLLPQARESFRDRDLRIAGLTDEAVDTYYSCTLCQSFAPNHVCVIPPERTGLCGAYSWLDCRAAYEINPTGPNQPIQKGGTIDAAKGEWEGINKFVNDNSHRSVERFTFYSLMDSPMTTCGCCEAVMIIVPEANGVMIVSRDDLSMTPCGMTFTTLMATVGGGQQTPGMMGHSKRWVTSPKFIPYEGGIKRVVWISKNIKEEFAEELKAACERAGVPDLMDKIADSDSATTLEELLPFLEQKGHPALTMEPLL